MVSIPPGSALGRYRVIEQLGRGGMATVFRCHDPNLDRYVAVKVLPSYHTEDPTFIGRFTQEAQTVARLNHPNILRIYDFGEDKGFTYIVTELVPGGDLQDILKGEPLAIEKVLELMNPLAGALDYAHGEGIIHRDLKPANILLDQDGRPILADFGLALMLQSATRFTLVQQAIGTPEYMSPEQAYGTDADHRSDLYSFGIMIYQLLLGETPFRAETPAATLMAHIHQPLPLPTSINPEIGPRLEATVLKALAKDPNDRFQSARELIQALSIASGLAVDPTPRQGGADTEAMDIGAALPPDAPDEPTAILGTAGDAAARPQVMAGEPDVAAPAVRRRPPMLLVGGGVAGVVVAVAVIAAFFALSGGGTPSVGDDTPPLAATTDQPTAPPASEAAVAAPTAEATHTPEPKPSLVTIAEPTPAMSLAEAVAALEGLTTRAEENVIRLRDLSIADDAVKPQFRTRQQLESITKGILRRDSTRELIFEAEELYKVLELMDEDDDLEDILTGIQLQQVYALFDDGSGSVFVLSDATYIGPLEELAYASAFLGGVQQELHDIAGKRKRAMEGSSDELRALDALIKGDVAQVAIGYISTFTEDQLAKLREPLPDNKLVQAPRVIQATALFPQRAGADFVAELYGTDNKGWEGVNEAYSRPPLSTEQVLHPNKYFADEEYQRTTMPNLAARMGKGWTQLAANTMGEFLIRTYLEEHLGGTQAADAAGGWGGDRYSLLRGPEGERVLVLLIKWDSFEDSTEFFRAYEVFAGIKMQQDGGTSESVGQSGRKWAMPKRTIFLGQIGPVIMLIIGDKGPLVDAALGHLDEALRENVP